MLKTAALLLSARRSSGQVVLVLVLVVWLIQVGVGCVVAHIFSTLRNGHNEKRHCVQQNTKRPLPAVNQTPP